MKYGDLIDRQAAIDALNRHLDTIPVVNNNTMEMIRRSEAMDCREIINGLPSAQPEKMQLSTEKTQLSEEDATKDTTFDCISRQAAIDALAKFVPYAICDESTESYTNGLTDAYNLICQLPSVQPEQIARDIATIIENEKDMRVVLKNAEHTETHSCDYERTETHDWIPVTERQPNHELAIVQFSDGDFSLLQFPTAYRWKDIVAWFPLPEPYKEGQDEQAD